MTSFFGPRPGQIPANMHLGPAARMTIDQLGQWHRQQTADLDNGSVSGSVTITWRARQRQVITLAGDVTLAFDWASAPPGTYLLTIVQDATGGHSVTWGTGTPGSVWWTAGPDIQAQADGASLAVIEWDGWQAVGACLRCGSGDRIPTVWDSTWNTNLNVVYSNGDRDVASDHWNKGMARTVFGATSGLWYVEVQSLSDYTNMGVVSGLYLTPGAVDCGNDAGGLSVGCINATSSIRFQAASAGTSPAPTGGVRGIVLDATNGRVKFRNASSETSWIQLSGHVAGTAYYIASSSNTSSPSSGRINAGQDAFVHGLPSGCEPIFGDY